uniref:DNA-directed RNA polymerase subunit n=1 Tax=Phacus pleuronectes TaxID=102908 RepID=A0A3G3LLS6_9EUGL|nr:RNA polymerase beta' subunit [Phacus pleuronectes]AYQ93660.1 RNA polymerase beta' subunit [Phacus pleuronectes]
MKKIKKYIKINLASPKKILKWSERSLPNGELLGKVTKSETVDIKNLKPITNGLFCEKIFGPIKSNQCHCKLYKKIKMKKDNFNLIICPKCYVQITDSKIRRYRMGTIQLASTNIHTWYLNNNSNYIRIILSKNLKEIENITYGKSYISFKKKQKKIFKTTGEAIKIMLKKIKLKQINIKNIKINEEKTKKKFNIINSFLETKTKPIWMTISYLPVLPPELRPIIKLQDNVIVSSDFNFLYSKIINTNNRLYQLKEMNVNEKFINKEKITLQESIDLLINNKKNKNKKNKKKKIKSLSETIKGKHGRIRENLLGKTVDYSARSVIVVEPKLNINECGIPKEILIELFQSLIIKKLFQLKLTNNIKEAKKIINNNKKKLLKNYLLKKIIQNLRILLNRAPTLHRLGIQSFHPKLTSTKSIKLHPLVCSAFNADFDGDQMGIHLPLSLKGQSEARILMISTNNCTSPATGKPNITPSQDIILGCYFLTSENISLQYLLEKIKYFDQINLIINMYKKNNINIHSYIWVKEKNRKTNKNYIKISKINNNKKLTNIKRTTLGKIIFSKTINKFL